MHTLLRLIADGTLVLILLVSGPVILWSIRNRLSSALPVLIMAGLTSLVVGKLMSLLYQPAVARPFIALGVQPGAAYIDNPGFPSDHALLATATVLALYMVTRNKKLAGAMTLLVVVMCIGRVVALVHTPLDVVGGVIAGLAGYFWYKKLTK